MASTRRRSSTGFSASVDETVEAVEETSTEEIEEIVEEKEGEEEKVVAEVKQIAAVEQPLVLNNPKPVVAKNTPRRNTPRFSAQR